MNRNLLIVDDEYEILSWLEELFTYEFEPELEVYTADCAVRALELLNQVKFDVVLTDIKMPGMDGITLFHKIKSNWPRCRTVFLTGFRDYDDMYRIVNHKDVRYILKSEGDEVIMKAVRDSLTELEQELELELRQKESEETLSRARFWKIREFLDRILAGDMKKEEIIKQEAELEFPVLLEDACLLFLIRIDNEKEEGIQSAEFRSFLEIVSVLVRGSLPENVQMYMHIMENQQALLFLQSRKEREDWNRVFAVACGAVEYAQDAFRKRTGMSFSAAVASEPVNFDRIARMVIRLRQVMVGYLGNEREVIAHVETLITDRKAGNMDREASGSIRLKSCLELQRRQEFFDILSACGEELTEAGSRHDPRAMELYYSISVMLLQFINENHLNEKIAFRIGLYKLTKVDEHASWMEAYQYLSDVSEAVFGLLGDNEKSLSGKALKRVCDYIDHHLSGDLTLPRLADEGGFNASYLSRLFKQVYGITITDYIYQKRMKLAMELLASTNQKIQDIVEQTGYLSAHSFARAFRSYAGISPSEYREQAKK